MLWLKAELSLPLNLWLVCWICKPSKHDFHPAVAVSHQISKASNAAGSSTSCAVPPLSGEARNTHPLWGHCCLACHCREEFGCYLWNCVSGTCGLFLDISSAASWCKSTKSALLVSAYMCPGHLLCFVQKPH